jgi:TRAP-type transport system small permease protein
MKLIDGLLKIISVIFEGLTRLLLVVMVAIITWHVVSRQIFHKPTSWAEEISLVMIIWFGLIGATFGVRDRYHLRMDIIFRLRRGGWRIAVAYLAAALFVVLGVLMLGGGTQHVGFTLTQPLPATKLPGAIRYAPLVITGAMIAIYGIRNMLGGGPAADALQQAEPDAALKTPLAQKTQL